MWISGGQDAELRASSFIQVPKFPLATLADPYQQIFGCLAETVGVNMSGSEFSYGTYPTANDLDYVRSRGIALIRLPISWELMQSTLNGPLNQTYLNSLENFLSSAAARGISVIVDLHNYGRYHGGIGQTTDTAAAGNGQGNTIGSAAVPISAFVDFWTKLAGALKDQPGVYAYDIMNEPHDMGNGQLGDSALWKQAAQAAVNGIRSVDTNTTVMVEGTQYSSTAVWQTYNANFIINDPANNLVYQAHQYFDGAGGGGKYNQTYDQLKAYPNIGVDLIQPWLDWLQQHNVKGFLGEFGVPDNDPRWLDILERVLLKLNENEILGTMWAYRNQAGWWSNPLFLNSKNGKASPQMTILMAHTWPTITSFTADTMTADAGHASADVLTITGIAVAGSVMQLFDGSKKPATTTADSTGGWTFTIKRSPFGARMFRITTTVSASGVGARIASIFAIINRIESPSNKVPFRCIAIHHATKISAGAK
jgi:aryl-phospho-beta-D-glucosidase BglC (GH1 family)